jgi:hypothetical protein
MYWQLLSLALADGPSSSRRTEKLYSARLLEAQLGVTLIGRVNDKTRRARS